MYSLLKAVT